MKKNKNVASNSNKKGKAIDLAQKEIDNAQKAQKLLLLKKSLKKKK